MRKRSEARRGEKREPDRERAAPQREWMVDVPNNPVTEMVVLGAMFADESACDRVRPLCPPDAFFASTNRRIRQAVELARTRGMALDPATLARLDPEVDVLAIEKIMAARPDVPDDLDFHIEHLRFDHEKAKVAQGPLHSFLEAFQDPATSRAKLKVYSAQIAEAFAGKGGRARYLRDTSNVVEDMMRQAEERRRQPGLAWPFGIRGLDFDEEGEPRLCPGAAPGGITLLTATTGGGKTLTSAHMILGLARQKRKVLVGAWEVRAPMTMATLVIFSLGWSKARWLAGYSSLEAGKVPITNVEMDTFRERAEAISKWVVFMENPTERDMELASNPEVIDVLEEHVEASGCSVAVWDLLDRAMNDTRPDDEKRAMNRLLRMGDRQQIHQIVLHQNNMKGNDARADGIPTLASIKGSTGYSENASLVLAGRIPSQWKDVPADTIEYYALKQRDGGPFAVEMDWDPPSGRISGGRTFNPRAIAALGDETNGATSRSFGPKKKARK